MGSEPWVSSRVIAEHLGLTVDRVTRMAREGHLPARALPGTKRRTWLFRLSEVEASLLAPEVEPLRVVPEPKRSRKRASRSKVAPLPKADWSTVAPTPAAVRKDSQ